jgi:amidophosphoribosyltransferase
MIQRLYQGVQDEFDASQALRSVNGTGFGPYGKSGIGPGAPGLASETWEPADPKLREECGVVAVHGHPDAARQVYLGLYALQHRGQESAGIASADGQRLANIKGMGLVS